MKNTQLVVILRSMDISEFKELGKYVISPYFNNRSEVIRFYDALKKHYPLFDSDEFTDKIIFDIVYPGKNFSDVLMRKLVSLTTNLVLDFIAVKGFRNDSIGYNILLIDKLSERGLVEMFQKRSRILNEHLDSSKHDFAYYQSRLRQTSLLNGYFLNTDEKSMIKGYQKELDDLMQFFFSGVLLMYVRLTEWSRTLNHKFNLTFFNEVVNHFSLLKTDNVTLATLYFNMLMLIKTDEEKYYDDLINSSEQFRPNLSDADAYNTAIVLIQYCHKKVLKGNSEFRYKQFEITKGILKDNIIPPGFIEPYFFTNIIRNATAIQECDWAENFLYEYRHKLKPEIATEICDYSFAMIEITRGNFERSLTHLSKINIERSNMKLDIKNLQIVIYYELNYAEELISLTDAFKHYLRREKTLPELSVQNNLKFLGFVSDLVKVRLNKNSKTAYLLNKQISESEYFGSKEWLLRKSEDLMK